MPKLSLKKKITKQNKRAGIITVYHFSKDPHIPDFNQNSLKVHSRCKVTKKKERKESA